MKVKCNKCGIEWNTNAIAKNVQAGKIGCKSQDCEGLAVIDENITVSTPPNSADGKESLLLQLEEAIGEPKSIERTKKINNLRAEIASCSQS